MRTPLRLGIMFSGEATTACAIIRACQTGYLRGVEIGVAIASTSQASGIAAINMLLPECPLHVVVRRNKPEEQFGEEILKVCRMTGLDILGQYGWMPQTPQLVTEVFDRRMINQHPAPLDPGRPDFGGRGMRRRAVHAAVLYFSQLVPQFTTTEATAQYVAYEYDKGPLIYCQSLTLEPEDTPERLAQRLLLVEHELQIEALRLFANGKAKPCYRAEPLIALHDVPALFDAKARAIREYPKG